MAYTSLLRVHCTVKLVEVEIHFLIRVLQLSTTAVVNIKFALHLIGRLCRILNALHNKMLHYRLSIFSL